MDNGQDRFFMIFIVIILSIILPQGYMMRQRIRLRQRKGNIILTKELMECMMGKSYRFTYAMTGTSIKGMVVSFHDNWIEIETKKETCLVNVDFVNHICEINPK